MYSSELAHAHLGLKMTLKYRQPVTCENVLNHPHDSSDSSEYAPEQQYQVRTDSNIQTLLLKETVNQNATKCA